MAEMSFKRNVPKKENKEVEETKEEVKETIEEKEEIKPKPKSKDIGVELVSCLFHKRTQFHIWHLQTTSLAEHKALNKLYDELLDLADSIIEEYQGYYGRVYGVCSYEFEDYANADKMTKYLDDFCYEVKDWKQQLDINPNLCNLFDELIGLICKSKYLLTLK